MLFAPLLMESEVKEGNPTTQTRYHLFKLLSWMSFFHAFICQILLSLHSRCHYPPASEILGWHLFDWQLICADRSF